MNGHGHAFGWVRVWVHVRSRLGHGHKIFWDFGLEHRRVITLNTDMSESFGHGLGHEHTSDMRVRSFLRQTCYKNYSKFLTAFRCSEMNGWTRDSQFGMWSISKNEQLGIKLSWHSNCENGINTVRFLLEKLYDFSMSEVSFWSLVFEYDGFTGKSPWYFI